MKRIFSSCFLSAIVISLALFSCAEPVEVQDNTFSIYDATGKTPESVEVPSEGQTGYKLRIMAGSNWNLRIPEGAEWISTSITSAPKGVREVSVDFAENEELVPRSGRMDFICASKTVSIIVKQEKGEKVEDVTPDPNDPSVNPSDTTLSTGRRSFTPLAFADSISSFARSSLSISQIEVPTS